MKSPRPFDPGDLSSMPLVHMVSAGAPIHDGQVNRAWSAMVQTAGSTEPALTVILKWMPSRIKVAIELGCSLAAMALRLPVPRGMLVLANPAMLLGLPPEASPLPGHAEVLCYASMLRWPETARVRNGDPAVDEYLWSRFCETATAAPGAAWDELVANGDRHAGNFIYDGKRYWLIDHDLALKPLATAVDRMVEATVRMSVLEHRAAKNQVATNLKMRRPDTHDMLSQPRAFGTKTKALEALASTMNAWRTGVSPIDAVFSDAETVVRGIILRLPALGLQLADRLAHSSDSTLTWTTQVDSSLMPR